MKSHIKGALSVGTYLEGQTGSYKIERALGQGSFGITYQASMRVKGNLGYLPGEIKVAIKEFYMHSLNTREESGGIIGSQAETFQNYLVRFQKEAHNLSKMNHRGIVKVLELFDANDTSYLVMEYLEGGSLDERIRMNQHLSERESLNTILKVGEALGYMHSQHMLHLDLKPLNIMLDKDGQPLLIDFGLSKVFDENGIPETSTGIGLGTPGYAPIEQVNYDKSKGIAPTLDIYALGGTLFKCLTGKTPPTASAVNDDDDFLPHLLAERKVSQPVSELVVWAMQPRKKDRPQTVADFLTHVQEVIEVLPEGVTSSNGAVLSPQSNKRVSLSEDASLYNHHPADATIYDSKDKIHHFKQIANFLCRLKNDISVKQEGAIQNLLKLMTPHRNSTCSYLVQSLPALNQIICDEHSEKCSSVVTDVRRWCQLIDIIRKETGLPFRIGSRADLDNYNKQYIENQKITHEYTLKEYIALEPSTGCFVRYNPFRKRNELFNLNANPEVEGDILLVCDSFQTALYPESDYQFIEPFAYCFYLGKKEDGYDILDKDMNIVHSNKVFGYQDTLHYNSLRNGDKKYPSGSPLIGNLFTIQEDIRESSKWPELFCVGPNLTLQPGWKPTENEDTY